MENVEKEKFTETINKGFEELIKVKPEKPMEHFIYFLLNSIPEELRKNDEKMEKFYETYKESLKQNGGQ